MATFRERRKEILDLAEHLNAIKRDLLFEVSGINDAVAKLVSAADTLMPEVADEISEQPTTRAVRYDKIGASARDVSDVLNQRKCGFCNEAGHDKRNCVKFAKEKQKSKRKVH